jgi:hypothetical protein
VRGLHLRQQVVEGRLCLSRHLSPEVGVRRS